MQKYRYLDKLKHICTSCPKTANLKLCSRCRSVFYCSREHQVSDWKIHKLECKKLARRPCTDDNTKIVSGNMYPVRSSNATLIPTPTNHDNRYLETLNHLNNYTDSLSSSESLDFLDSSCENDASTVLQNRIRASPVLPQDCDFDQRPLKLLDFPQPVSDDLRDVTEFTTSALRRDGYCVLDNVCGRSISDAIVDEVMSLERSGALQPGQLQGDSAVNRSIRSDKILWFAGSDPRYPAIATLIKKMDAIVGGLNYHLAGQHVIKGRTKAMITCYPGDGTWYMKHIDNPSQDGRIITCIMYLNKEWDVKRQGGLLRLFPTCTDYVDVAPIQDRILLFWSDSRNPHEVQPAYDNRYAVTLWYFDKEERQIARKKEYEAQNLRNITPPN